MVKRVIASMLLASVAYAEPAAPVDPAARFEKGVTALAAGQADEAIAHFEQLANAGVVDASVSFDRGLAYAARLTQSEPKPGDFGQAIAAFEEANALATEASLRERADHAADAVRGELARKRHRDGARAAFEPAPSPAERSIEILPEWGWFALACLFALLALLPMLTALPRNARGLRLAWLLVMPTLVCAWTVRGREERYGRAVVVAESARLIDEESGRPLADTEPLVEGALITIEPLGATEIRVHAAGIRGLLPRTSVRVLAR